MIAKTISGHNIIAVRFMALQNVKADANPTEARIYSEHKMSRVNPSRVNPKRCICTILMVITDQFSKRRNLI